MILYLQPTHQQFYSAIHKMTNSFRNVEVVCLFQGNTVFLLERKWHNSHSSYARLPPCLVSSNTGQLGFPRVHSTTGSGNSLHMLLFLPVSNRDFIVPIITSTLAGLRILTQHLLVNSLVTRLRSFPSTTPNG